MDAWQALYRGRHLQALGSGLLNSVGTIKDYGEVLKSEGVHFAL